MASKKKSLHDTVVRAQNAWRELEMNLTTQADKKRIWDVLAGLSALDDEQAHVKGRIEELVIEFFNPNAPNDSTNELLRQLLAIIAVSAQRPKEDQEALDAIAHELAKEDKRCLKERPTRPKRKAASARAAPASASTSTGRAAST